MEIIPRRLVPSVIPVLLITALPAGAGTYQEAPVSHPGEIHGRVTLSGEVPEPAVFKIKDFPDQDYCMKKSDGKGNRVLQPVQLEEGGGLDNVVVAIEDVHGGKPFQMEGIQVNAENCEFIVQGGPSPLTGVMVDGVDFRVLNLDSNPNNPKEILGVTHNPQGFEIEGSKKSMIFNFLISTKGQNSKRRVKITRANGYISVVCNIHNYMQVFFLPVENPYYSIAGKGGAYSIAGIPPGKYSVTVWNPVLGRLKKKVEILPDRESELNFNYEK